MKTSESIAKISASLAKAQTHIGGAEKTASNTFHKSKYATLGDVIVACKQALFNEGISVLQLIGCNESGLPTLTTTLLHESGEHISTEMILPIPAAKAHDVQATGSAITYCRRYQLQALLNIPAVDDDGEFARKAFSEADKTEAKAEPKSEPKAEKVEPETSPTANWRSLVVTGVKNPAFRGKKLGDLSAEDLDNLLELIDSHPESLSGSKTLQAIRLNAAAGIDELLSQPDEAK